MRLPIPADDGLHAPTSPDIFWTETAWFAFTVPDRCISAYIYPVFRTNQGVCSSGMYIWDASGEHEHAARYFHNYWHLPMPEDLTTMHLASGLAYDVLKPLKRYRVRYESDRAKLDLIYEGLVAPVLTPREDHLDQPCRVTGRLILDGELIEVDTFAMRDKSWSVRSDRTLAVPPDLTEGSYCYGINGDTAFLARTMSSDPSRAALRRGGWLMRDGLCSPIVSGTRNVERPPGRPPSSVTIEGTDELGRIFRAVGTPYNHFALRSTPAMVPWISGVAWTIDGATAWGENQEWSLPARG